MEDPGKIPAKEIEMRRTIRDMHVYATPAELAAAAAEEFFTRALQAHAEGGIFSCALSGGSTPAYLFAKMSAPQTLDRLPSGFWRSVHFFWGDERDVPSDHPDSNYRLARETLLCRIDIPEENIHPIRAGYGPASVAAASYENELRRFFALKPGGVPHLDLIFLGMGDDGHIASLFPHSEALNEKARLVTAPWVAKLNSYRVTMTLPVLNNAAYIMFLIQGSGKAETLRRVLMETWSPDQLPAQAIRPEAGELIWLVDRAAAARLAYITDELPQP
jgi:6-phosphogluconolactonase